jgi:hypothetical protein
MLHCVAPAAAWLAFLALLVADKERSTLDSSLEIPPRVKAHRRFTAFLGCAPGTHWHRLAFGFFELLTSQLPQRFRRIAQASYASARISNPAALGPFPAFLHFDHFLDNLATACICAMAA